MMKYQPSKGIYAVAVVFSFFGMLSVVRLHPAPQWALVAMTLLMMFQLVSESAGGSPFYSREQMTFNRFLLMLPLILSCAYVVRPSFRAACRELRRQ